MANITGNIDLGEWLGKMYTDYQAKSAQKDTMFGQGISTLQNYADIFKPGGAYGAGTEAMIARGEKKAVAGGMQNLVSAGLANTTMPMHLGQTFQEEVGMPTRLASRDRGMELYGGAMGALGRAYTNYNPVNPSGFGISSMATGGFSTMMQGRLADMQMQGQMRDRQAVNQAGLSSSQMFSGPAGSGGGGSGGGGGGGMTNDWGYGGIDTSDPYGGGGGGGVSNDGQNEMWGLYGAEQFSGGLGTMGQGDAASLEGKMIEGTSSMMPEGFAGNAQFMQQLADLKEGLAKGHSAPATSPQAHYEHNVKKLMNQYEYFMSKQG